MSLEVQIEKRFEKFHLRAEFSSGEGITGLLGASGCGKSMTLKCVAGILTPDKGRIVLDGRVLFDSEQKINLPPQQRRVGYLFQHYALFPHMTVRQNIAAGVREKGEARGRVEELMARFHLEELGEKLPRQLSGGQQQRVALARILASRPEALLLDEPFSALDSYLKWQVELELDSLLREFPGSVVLVTHNREEIYRLCNRACVLDHGRSQPMHRVKELFQTPGTLSACLLSGCKNVSPAILRPDGLVEAMDWGVTFQPREEPPRGLAHVGIRSHHLRLTGGEGDVAIPCRVERVMEDVFSTVVLLRPVNGTACLRLDAPKEEWREMGDRLEVWVAPQHIMLLTP